MVKLKILGEKAMKSIKGGLCCWEGGGCDCTSSGGDLFKAPSNAWLDKMDGIADGSN